MPEKKATNVRTETPSFTQFNLNMERVEHFYDVTASAFRELMSNAKGKFEQPIWPYQHETLEEFNRRQIEKGLYLLERRDAFLEWVPVMLVTFTEAYLQDVLAYLVVFNSKLMAKSEIAATYTEVVEAGNIENLASDLRARWARGIVADGGPTKWARRLAKIIGIPPEKEYPVTLIEQMELLWGVRHVIVHSAGIGTKDFAERHPKFGLLAGERIRLQLGQTDEWKEAVTSFVTITDGPIVGQTNAQLAAR